MVCTDMYELSKDAIEDCKTGRQAKEEDREKMTGRSDDL